MKQSAISRDRDVRAPATGRVIAGPGRSVRLAFSLVELLVVIAIIAVLVALLVPAVQKIREAANRVQCANNVKQVALAVHSYHDAHRKLPNLCNWYSTSANLAEGSWNGGTSCDDGAAGTWLVHLLPYVEQLPLYQQMFCSDQTPITALKFPPYTTYAAAVVPTFVCPSDPTAMPGRIQQNGFASCSYSGNVMVFDPVDPRPLGNAMPDGTSNTVMIAERYMNCGTAYTNPVVQYYNQPAWAFIWPMEGSATNTPGFGWYTAGYRSNWNVPGGFQTDFSSVPATASGIPFQVAPLPAGCNPAVTQSAHAVMVVGLGDGSVRTVTAATSLTTWGHACNPLDGHPLGNDW
jgi:prepilin-type N-terminal cleavage/methylation domain-containing protein